MTNILKNGASSCPRSGGTIAKKDHRREVRAAREQHERREVWSTRGVDVGAYCAAVVADESRVVIGNFGSVVVRIDASFEDVPIRGWVKSIEVECVRVSNSGRSETHDHATGIAAKVAELGRTNRPGWASVVMVKRADNLFCRGLQLEQLNTGLGNRRGNVASTVICNGRKARIHVRGVLRNCGTSGSPN